MEVMVSAEQPASSPICVNAPTATGAAPDVLLLRGLGRESGHWLSFPEELQRRLGSNVYALDNPGVGSERGRQAPWSMAATADDIVERFNRQREGRAAAGAFIVVGLSLGGMLALEISARGLPGLVGGVVINSSSPRGTWIWQRIRPVPFWSMLKTLVQGTVARERTMIPFTMNNVEARQRSAAVREEIAVKRPVSGSTFWAQCMCAATWRPPKQCALPLLILASSADKLVHPVCSTVLAKQYGAALKCHPTAGHDITSDDGQWVQDSIVEWLNASSAKA